MNKFGNRKGGKVNSRTFKLKIFQIFLEI